MDKIINLEVIAQEAYKSENFEQSYKYFSELLEYEIENSDYWLGKGISVLYLSHLENMRVKEGINCIKKSDNLKSLGNKEQLSIQLLEITEIKLKQSLSYIDKCINDEFNALHIPSGTLHSVHNMRKENITYEICAKYRESITEYFDLAVYACNINNTKNNNIKVLNLLNFMFDESKKRKNFFGATNELSDLNSKINNIWNVALKNVKMIDPSFSIISKSPVANSGCFIATATTRDYDHPTVIQLRKFRDQNLLTNNRGSEFVKFYYKYSPKIANFIAKSKGIRKMTYIFFVYPLSVITKIFTK